MQRLYLLRHGIALPHGTPDIADADRPLTPKGERRVREVAYGLKRWYIKLDKILTSPLPRAFRTAEITARVLGLPDSLEMADELRADRNAESIASWVRTRTEENLLIVGHNPALSDLVGLLVTGHVEPRLCELRRAGMAGLSSSSDGDGKMSIDWIARPRLIRRLSDR